MSTDDPNARGDGPSIDIVLRVPGPWTAPEAFDAALPDGYELANDGDGFYLLTPPAAGGERDRVPLQVRPFDDEFVAVFAGGCERTPSEADRAGVERHAALVCPIFPGGSVGRARAALRHAAALIRAGGHGVFVDNSGIAHGSDDWLALAQSPDDGGAFYALVCVYGSPERLWSMGMHTIGHRDAELVDRSGDDRRDDFTLRNFLAYSYRSGATIHDGDRLADVVGGESLVARVVDEPDAEIPDDHPMRNPFGRYRLERVHGGGAPVSRGPA